MATCENKIKPENPDFPPNALTCKSAYEKEEYTFENIHKLNKCAKKCIGRTYALDDGTCREILDDNCLEAKYNS